MPISKVEFGEKTLIDLSNDTVTAATLLNGVTAHDASGNEIVGTMSADSSITIDPLPVENSANAVSSGGVYAMFAGLVADFQEALNSIIEDFNAELEKKADKGTDLGDLKFQKSTTAPNDSTDENTITFVS